MYKLPPYFDLRCRPDSKWDIWALLPDPILGRYPINHKVWQIVGVEPSKTQAHKTALALNKSWLHRS